MNADNRFRLRDIKNGQVILAMILLIFVVGGCSDLASKLKGDDKNEAIEKVESPKVYELEDATDSSEMLNAMKPHRTIGDYAVSEMFIPEETDGEKRIHRDAVAEVQAIYKAYKKEPITLAVSKFKSKADSVEALEGKLKELKKDKLKPVKGNKNGIDSIIWRDGKANSFMQCQNGYCFEAHGEPAGKELEDLLEPLVLITKFREMIK